MVYIYLSVLLKHGVQYFKKNIFVLLSMLQNFGFPNIFENSNDINLKSIIQRICDQYYQQRLSEIESSTKLETYKFIKDYFEIEKKNTFVQKIQV